jgi:hypothetical protein
MVTDVFNFRQKQNTSRGLQSNVRKITSSEYVQLSAGVTPVRTRNRLPRPGEIS